MGIPFSGPTIPTNITVPGNPGSATSWTGQDCGQLIQNLSKSVSQFVSREVRLKKSRSARIQKDFEARKSGGFWDKITAGPLGNFQKAVSKVTTNAQDVSNGGGGLLGKYGQYMDMSQTYSGMVTTLASGVVSNVVDEVGVVGQLADAAGVSSLLPTGQGAGCDRNLLAATVGSTVRIAGRAVNNAVQSVFNVQATLGMALDVVPDLFGGLMSLPVGALSILLTNRETILDRIASTVEDAIKVSIDIEEDDYPFDHRSFILEAKAALEDADGDLGQVEATLEAGGSFVESLWDRAQSTIKETGDELLGGPAGFALTTGRLKLLQLVGYQKLLESLIDILIQRQEAFSKLISAVGSFQTSFEKNAQFKNMASPLIQQIRCTLQQVIQDMGRTADMNGMFRFYLKEKQWGLELLQLAMFMDGAGGMVKGLSIPSTSINSAAESLSASVTGFTGDLSSAEQYSGLITQLTSFIDELKRKVVSDVPTDIIESVGASIAVNIDIMKQNDSDLGEMIESFNNGFVGDAALTVLQGVNSVVNFMEDAGLDNMLDKLKNGDLEGFFSMDALKTQLESIARRTIGDVSKCCADNAGDGDTQDRLININRVMLAFQRGKDKYNRYVGKYAENYIKNTQTRILPQLQRIRQDINKISKSRCINKGDPGTASQLGLILY